MAVKPFSKEQLNFFKFSTLVLDEFPKVLRQIFITMWNSTIAIRPGFIPWDDSTKVQNMLLRSEGGKTDIPTTKSIEEWDCTALFKATIYAKTFCVPGSKGTTLNDLYLKKIKPAPGSFYSSVQSSTGNQDETYALAIDQLRLLRNTLCHSHKPEIIKNDFDQYVQLVTNALTAVNIDTAFVDIIGQMSEDDFPTEKVQELHKCHFKELQANSIIHENIEQKIENMQQKLSSIDERTEKIENVEQGVEQKLSSIDERMHTIDKMHTMMKTINLEEKGNMAEPCPPPVPPPKTRKNYPPDEKMYTVVNQSEPCGPWEYTQCCLDGHPSQSHADFSFQSQSNGYITFSDCQRSFNEYEYGRNSRREYVSDRGGSENHVNLDLIQARREVQHCYNHSNDHRESTSNENMKKIDRFKSRTKEFLAGFESTHDEMRTDEETFIIDHLLKKNESDSPILDGNLDKLALLACCSSPHVVKRALDALLNEIFLSISDPSRIRCRNILNAEKILRESFLDFLKVDHLKAKWQRMTTYAWLITFVLLRCSKEELAEITPEITKIDKTLDALLKENSTRDTLRYGIHLAKEGIRQIALSCERKDGKQSFHSNIKRCENSLSSKLEKDEVVNLCTVLTDGGSWLDLHVCLVFLQDLPKFHRFQGNLKPIILIQMLVEYFRERSSANKVKSMLKKPNYDWRFEILVYHVMLRLIRTSKNDAIIEQVLMGKQGCGGVFRSWAENRSKTTKDPLVMMNVEKLCKRAVFLATPNCFKQFITDNCKGDEKRFIEDLSILRLLTISKDKVLEILPKSDVFVGKQRVITYDALISGKKCLLKVHQHTKEELLKTDALKNVPLRKEIEIIRVLNAVAVPCPSIVKHLGSSIEAPMHMMIERSPKGDVQTYLKGIVKSIEAEKLLGIALDICNAMIFLEGQNVIHRDLRAKNCFVFMQDGKLLVKLGDFHLAVLTYSDPRSPATLQSRENSVTSMVEEDFSSEFSVPWMAIEVLQLGEFSTASDVWSFGVLLFEIFTLGCKPYVNMPSGRSLESDEEVREFVLSGKRLELHPKIPDTIKVLIQLTMADLDDRPTFSHMRDNLIGMKFEDEMYTDSAFFQISHGNESDNKSLTNLATHQKEYDVLPKEMNSWFKQVFLDSKRKLKKEIHEELRRFPWLCGAYGLTGPNRKIRRPHIYLTVKRGVSEVYVLRKLGDMFNCDAEDFFELLEEPKRKPKITYLVNSSKKSNVESKTSTSVSSVHLAPGSGVLACSNPSYNIRNTLRVPYDIDGDDLHDVDGAGTLNVEGAGTITMFCSHNGQNYALTCCHVGFATEEDRLNATFNKPYDILKYRNSFPTYRDHAKKQEYYFTKGNKCNNNEPISLADYGSKYMHLGDFHDCHFDDECDILSLKVSDTTEIDCKVEDDARPDWNEIWDELYDRVIEETGRSPVEVEKIGFSSALTHGYIAPCDLSYRVEDISFQDAYVVKGCDGPFLRDGDSGSPVFFYDKNKEKQVFAYGVCKVDALFLPEYDEPTNSIFHWHTLSEQHESDSSIEDVFSTDEDEEIDSADQRNDKNKCKYKSVDQHEFQNENKIQSKEEYKDGEECRNEYENKNKGECVKGTELEVECQHENMQTQCECELIISEDEDENERERGDKSGDENDSEDNKYSDESSNESEEFVIFREIDEEYFICLRLDTALEKLGLLKEGCFNVCGSNL